MATIPTPWSRASSQPLVDAAVRQMLPPDLDLAPRRRGRRPKRLPLVEAWLAALSGPDGELDADAEEIAGLVSLLEPWDEASDVPTGPARATFRLSDLLANVGATRAGGPPAAHLADDAAPPLDACLTSFFSLQAPLPATSPATTASTAILDRLPPAGDLRGRTLNDLLRPAYVALGAAGDDAGTT